MTIHNSQEYHVASLVIFAAPQHISYLLSQLIEQGCTIPSLTEKKGKIVVVIEDDDEDQLFQKIKKIQALKNVLHLSLVYYQKATDEI